MNLTLSKLFTRILAVILCVCVIFSLTACAPSVGKIKKADQVCVSGALYESWMYVITDEAFLDEITDIFTHMKYKKSDDAVDMMNAGETLSFTFSKGEETLGKVIIDSSNRVCFEAGTQSYDITSEFDFGYIKSLVDKHVEAINESFDTTE